MGFSAGLVATGSAGFAGSTAAVLTGAAFGASLLGAAAGLPVGLPDVVIISLIKDSLVCVDLFE